VFLGDAEVQQLAYLPNSVKGWGKQNGSGMMMTDWMGYVCVFYLRLWFRDWLAWVDFWVRGHHRFALMYGISLLATLLLGW
jgi:hypothetical protein